MCILHIFILASQSSCESKIIEGVTSGESFGTKYKFKLYMKINGNN